MKERIEKCNVLYESWQMQCCGDPIEVGQVVDLTIDTYQEPWTLSGYHLDFFEDHHDRAEAKLRGLVMGIKAVFVEEYADEKRYSDNPNNIFAIYETTYIDGYSDVGDYGNHKTNDVCYYILSLADAVVGIHHKVHDCISNRTIEVSLRDNSILENCEGHNKSCASYVVIYNNEKQRCVDIPQHITHKLIKWQEEYKTHIKEGFEVWSQIDWYAWYIRGWVLMKTIKKLLPEDIILYYGDMGMSQGIITQIKGEWTINDGGRGVQIENNMFDKIEEGTFIPSTSVNQEYESDDQDKYMFIITRSEHHFFPTDMVVIQKKGCDMSTTMGKVVECLNDGIVVQSFGKLDILDKYSIELID